MTHPNNRTRARILLAGAMAALLLGVVSASGSSASTAAPADDSGPTPSTALPTIVLVHGAFADASGWSAEIARLEQAGYPVIAPADPLRGLTADSDYIRSLLATIPGPVVLVGHSYGGAVITNAARGADNVVALVYVAAFVPAEGTSVATSYDQTKYPGSLLTPGSLDTVPVENPVAPGGQDADLYIKTDLFRKIFAGDESKATAAVMAAEQRPLSYFAFTEISGEPAWKTIPSWDLVTLDDRAIAPGGQSFMARRAGAQITRIHSAHDVMVSHPDAVVDLVETAATSTR
jgi:pimeloyl-ACP methyl ester carboxylesterase